MLRFLNQPGGSVSLVRRAISLPTLVSLGVAAAFLLFLVVRFDVDLSAIWEQVKSSNPWYLALAVVVHYTTFIFRGARWRLLLRNAQGQDQPVPGVLYCSELILLGWFANSVAWFRLGDAYRAYLYQSEQDGSFSRTIGTILSERMLDTMLVVLLLAASVPFLLVGQGGGASWTVMGTALALLAILIFGLLVIARSRQHLLRWLPRWAATRYQRFCEGALDSFRQIPLATLLGLLGWLAEVGRLYLVALALGIDLTLALVVFITLANSLLTLVPTPGGVGAVESGVAGLLVRLSALATSTAAALVLVDRSISYLSIIISGTVLFLARQSFRRRSFSSRTATVIEHH
jgi:uncharacterized protein (TIRG00374 family)